ncbi:asparagine synthase (glutamine-hydrolyzing) [Alkalihalobacterium alkalinitrilicum]|uniref:asparagine synthase (glutamine-hydrolyzing) n=1 Tax=Alkalihalobacterium alkalinitrilicum TaxID=427920 RepID=UPI000994A497|nr:asparagine synthase (glutamine-hydrolyzing) [Alkalihalobacterium alkalinitrilicum]
MCGFVSCFEHSKNSFFRKEIIEQATKKLMHRGPDDEGVYHDEHVSLGFRRLSIVDIDRGKQPLSYENERYWIVFNGEIYNHHELQKELLEVGINLSTDSDTEVIVALYSFIGKGVVHKLRGMFSFLIWDTEKKKLFGARDPFGIKPLYVVEVETGVGFASDVKALLPLIYQPQVKQSSLEQYLTFQYVPDTDTMIEGVSKIQPGHYFDWEPGSTLQQREYFHPTFEPKNQDHNELVIKVRGTIEDSVSYHLRSDVEVGCFLSGGIDSTIVATLASQQYSSLKTFSVDFNEVGYSEMDVAEKTAAVLGVQHFPYTISAEEVIKELPSIIWHLDDPVADPAAIPLYFVSKLASQHVKVVLSGEGADELFGGYNIYQEPIALHGFRYLSPNMKRALVQLVRVIPEGVKGRNYMIRGCTPLEERYVGNAKIFSNKEKQRVLRHELCSTYQDITKQLYNNSSKLDSFTKMQYIDIMTWLRGDILVKADKMSMAHSIELRVPFLDREVWNIAKQLSTVEKITKYGTKQILRQAFSPVIPGHVVNRRKLGFPVPIRIWLKNQWYDWAKDWIKNDRIEEYIDQQYILDLLDEHALGRKDYSRKLWTVLCFSLWITNVFRQENLSKESRSVLQTLGG